jgi:hypothetical protein
MSERITYQVIHETYLYRHGTAFSVALITKDYSRDRGSIFPFGAMAFETARLSTIRLKRRHQR